MNPRFPQIPGHELIERIGTGAFAHVYLARETSGSLRAIKVLHPELIVSEDELVQHESRFFDELTTLRMFRDLAHPSLPSLVACGTDTEGLNWLATDFVPGLSLSQISRQLVATNTKLPISMALSIAQGLLEALVLTHSRTDTHGEPKPIFHRDIKPANVMVSARGTVTLLDWGIAKREASVVRTKARQTVGSLLTMPPEQLHLGVADARTDIYAVAATLWYLLTGKQLFPEAKTEPAHIQHITHVVPPSICSIRSDIPEYIDHALLVALAKKPEDRHQSAQAFLDALLYPPPHYSRITPAAQSEFTALLHKLAPRRMHDLAQLLPEEVPVGPSAAPDTVSDSPLPIVPVQALEPMPLPTGATGLQQHYAGTESPPASLPGSEEPTVKARIEKALVTADKRTPGAGAKGLSFVGRMIESSLGSFLADAENRDSADTKPPPEPRANTLTPHIIEEVSADVPEPEHQPYSAQPSQYSGTNIYATAAPQFPAPLDTSKFIVKTLVLFLGTCTAVAVLGLWVLSS